ncbi:helix-turn-helix domain-containing protein [Methylobacterium trifolii]|uniref:HTH-type transcriptional regulator SutR n=1 Tax=Methylobacterium trifolii TaxID=1003092 RepID=A0ABQ4U5S3_9HYPH|nr:XRE family transcriptional regulator [Methylobacterium trifolii]GJE62621.1 HTH-type transcriptional regulator SutR [Methylobacterium trifolii]
MSVRETVAPAQIAAEADSQIHVSEEIRRRRRALNLSLEALAARSGVSRSMISKIERAEAVPSTIVLSRLAEALGVTFSRLMAPATDLEVLLIPARRQPVLRDEESGFLRRCLSPVLPGRGIDLVLNTLPPGAGTGEFTAHRRGVSEYIYVLRGRLRAVIGTRTVIAEAGDSLYFEADAGHAFSNVGTEICEYILVIDPSRVR